MVPKLCTLIAVVAGTMLALGGGTTADAQELLHGPPAYDSGWVSLPPDHEVVLVHALGGDRNDYVVDLQVRDLVDGHGGGYRVHQVGFGGDEPGGFWWEQLTTNQIVVVGGDGEGRIDQMRVRIWVVAGADYESGWTSFSSGQDIRWLTHGLGGALADYVVDLQFFDVEGKGRHNFGYGRSQWYGVGTWGAAWMRLDLSQVAVVRGANDSYVDNFRLRIFRRPSPNYDSGWRSASGGSFLPHDLGGPWNDFVVDLQFRDFDDDLGLNQVGYGGDILDDGTKAVWASYGAYWSHMSSRGIWVKRNLDDDAADEVRVRIWESRRPKWDSGWIETPQGFAHQFQHNIGGDPDTFVVDLQFQCTDGCWFGTTQNGYGLNLIYNSESGVVEQHGAGWFGLTSEGVWVVRAEDDQVADRVRVRLWIAPEPDFDLGWYDPLGQIGSFPFDISTMPGYASDWVVDLQGNDSGASDWGTNQIFYGTDNYTTDGVWYDQVGLAWTGLDNSSITVDRAGNHTTNARFRLRIWHNIAFDYTSTWQAISTFRTFSHSLDADPDNLVVDMHFKDIDLEGIHNRYYGGDRSNTGIGDRQGASWFGLGSNGVSVIRESDDQLVDSVRLRVWHTPDAANVIFHDGFESGDTSAW